MAAKIVAVVNQKGGVGKSSTALALAAGLSEKGYKVLAIDLDAQANFTYSIGATTEPPTILEILTERVAAQEGLKPVETGELLAASKNLAGADAFIAGPGKEYRLKEAIAGLSGKYDYIIVDTPPALGILTINALTAATSVVIPAQADIYSLQGIEQLAETIEAVRRYCNNSALSIDGILLTRYSGRGILSRDVAAQAEALAAKIGTRLYATRIREAIAVKEAQLTRQSLFRYAPGARVTGDYKAFLEEFLQTE